MAYEINQKEKGKKREESMKKRKAKRKVNQ